MKKIAAFLNLSRYQMATITALSLVSGLTNTCLMYFLNSARSLDLQPAGIVTLFAATLLVYAGSQRTLQTMLIGSSESSLHTIRLGLAQDILCANFRSTEQLGKDRLLSGFTHDALFISDTWPMMVGFYTSAVTIISSLAYLAYLTARGFLFTVTTIVLGIGIYLVMTKKANARFQVARRMEERMLGHVHDLVLGAKELKLNAATRQRLYRDDFTATTAQCEANNRKAKVNYADAGLAGSVVFFVLIGYVSFFFSNQYNLEGGVRNAYLVVLLFLLAPISRLVSIMPLFGKATVAVERLVDLKAVLVENLERSCSVSPWETGAGPGNWKKLRLSNLVYEYQTGSESVPFKIGPLDLEIGAGELVFITGGNGCGKSTLGKILTGIYAPTKGTLALDDLIVNEANLDQYRHTISTVFSDYHLFSDQLWHPDGKRQLKIATVLQRLGLDKKIQSLQKIDPKAFSQGQQKRLALVNVLMEDRSLVFFDEWAAEQDPVFKEYFYTDLLPYLKQAGRTVVAITHDDRYFYLADRIIKLESGQIADVTETIEQPVLRCR